MTESFEDFENKSNEIAEEVLTTGPMAVTEAKELTMTFDRWNGSDELREWTLDKTSQMRGSDEGQEDFLHSSNVVSQTGLRMMCGVEMFPDWMKNAPTPFSSVLVANREIAVRIIKAAKESGLKSIAVYLNPIRFSACRNSR